ncbi:MAG: radical SAM protein [Bacteroidaceae bacterium]|nr:radical SAM protein [Bacteroidaceae bacterium]
MKKFKSECKTVGGNEGTKCNYPARLDTYGCGCQHDCSYCYAKSLLDFRKLWNAQHPSVSTTEELRKEVRKLKKGDVVRLGGMTDCFQPLERTHRNTYNLIRMLNRKGIHYLIVTKSDLIASDEYLEILDPNLAHIQITVTTTDDQLSFTYEKASPPSKRIAAIEKLQERGFDVQLRLSPFIPQYIDFEKLNKVKCDKILIEFLRVNTWIRKWFDIDYSDYTVKQSGYNHLPLKKKKEYIQLITGFKEMTVCEDVTAHHQYWQSNFNHNPEDCCNLTFRKEKENE